MVDTADSKSVASKIMIEKKKIEIKEERIELKMLHQLRPG
jgi:hypothetical protein